MGKAVAWPSPEPDRMITRTQTKAARPVPKENMAKTADPMSIRRTRLRLSASCAIGTVSDRPSSAATATSDRIPALLRPNDFWMLGISRPNESRSISSTMLKPNRTASA